MTARLANFATLAAALAIASAGTVASAQMGLPPHAPGEAPVMADGVPEEVQGVDIAEQLGTTVPLDATFRDDSGKEVSLRDVMRSDRPTMLHLGYFRCPMLCTLVLNEAFRSLRNVDWTPGEDFQLVSISVNAAETPELAKAKKMGYLAEYDRTGVESGVRFLTGPQESIDAICEATGFRYRKQPDGEYAHPATLVMIAPDGRIVRYLYGVKFEPATVRMALLEASEGTIGTPLDRFILWCHQFDPTSKGYVLFAFRLVQIAGLCTIVLLATGILWMLRRESRIRAAARPTIPS